MTLREIRKMFVEQTGRHDLWNDDGTNNGADFYLQRGQRHLENLVSNGRMDVDHNITLIGSSRFCIENVRIVKDVYVKAVAQKRTKLVRISIDQARKYLLGEETSAEFPQYYCVFKSRGMYGESVEKLSEGDCSITTNIDGMDSISYNTMQILLLPEIARHVTLDVEIKTTSREHLLTDEDDINYWTEEWPEALLYSAQRSLEVSYRNTQGVKDWDAAIATILVSLDQDDVADDAYDVVRMEG